MIHLSDVFLWLVYFVLLYLLYRVLHQYTYWRWRRVPFVDSAPLVGHIYALILKRISVYDHCKKLNFLIPGAKYYGISDFNRPLLLLRDPELIREICIKAFDSFPEHRPFFTEHTDPILSKNLVALTGQKWKTMRNLMTPCFTAAKMKLMFELIDVCARDFVTYFEDPSADLKFEAKEVFGRYTCDVIATSAFGLEVNSMRDPDNQFLKSGRESANFSARKLLKIFLINAVPILKNLFSGGFLSEEHAEFFENLITETVEARREKGIVRPDMIQLLMEAESCSMKELVAQSFIFFLGGFDTTSTIMSLIAFELGGNPDVQEKLRQEVDRFFETKNEEKVSYDELNKLKYLDMVCSEVLRFYPPMLATDRLCVKEYQLPPPMEGYPGYKLMPGDVAVIDLTGIHMDPQFFSNPEKFDPERFGEERKHEINPYAYIPFGIGPRRCIGDRFAMMETKVLFVYLIRSFEIKLREGTEYPLNCEKGMVVIKPEGGCNIELVRRKKNL